MFQPLIPHNEGFMKTTLIIPCYNEAAGIPQLAERLKALIPLLSVDGDVEILFVDDGSVDGTAGRIREFLAGLPFRIVTHEINRGLGAALRTGFSSSRGEEIVTMDSDCTYDPIGVLDLLAKLRSGYDVVTGSPYHPEGEVVNVVPWRLMLSKALSRLYWIVLPDPLYTYTSCFRAYRRNILENLESTSNGFLAVTELLVSAILQHARIAEIPGRLHSRRFGASKINVVRVSISHLKYLIRVLLWRITGFPMKADQVKDFANAGTRQTIRTVSIDKPGSYGIRPIKEKRWRHAPAE